MLVLPGVGNDLLDLGGCDVLGKNPALTATFRMDLEHYARRAFAIHGKKFLQYANNEVHRGEIIVEEQYFVHAGWADTGLFGLQQRIVLFPNGHEKHSNQALEDGKRRIPLPIERGLCVTVCCAVAALRTYQIGIKLPAQCHRRLQSPKIQPAICHRFVVLQQIFVSQKR